LVSIRLEAKNLKQGPFNRLMIRNVTIIDGTSGPPYRPSNVVVEGDRITAIKIVSHPLKEIDQSNHPASGEHEIDAPGITSVVDIVSSEDLAWTVSLSSRVRNNEVVAPRVFPYARLSTDGYPVRFNFKGIVNTPSVAREWVRAAAGAVGLKFRGNPSKITEVIIDEAKKLGLKTATHLEQRGIGIMDIVDSARMDLDRQDHWYGLAESMLTERSIPYWGTDYIYNNEQDRWRDAGRVWQQVAKSGTSEWKTVMLRSSSPGTSPSPPPQYSTITFEIRCVDNNSNGTRISPLRHSSKAGRSGRAFTQVSLDWKTEDEAN
jgi:hypothetical protein